MYAVAVPRRHADQRVRGVAYLVFLQLFYISFVCCATQLKVAAALRRCHMTF